MGNIFLCNESSKQNDFWGHTQVCSTQLLQVSLKFVVLFIFTVFLTSFCASCYIIPNFYKAPSSWCTKCLGDGISWNKQTFFNILVNINTISQFTQSSFICYQFEVAVYLQHSTSSCYVVTWTVTENMMDDGVVKMETI